MNLPTRDQLEKRRGIVLLDMAAKMEAEDFHGVADCAMDAREIDAMLETIDAFMDPLNQKAPLNFHPHVIAGVIPMPRARDHAAAVYTASRDAFVCPCGMARRASCSESDTAWEATNA